MSTLKAWYVAGQRLCNFDCPYCVSVGDWSKSRRYDWRDPEDRRVFGTIVDWLGTRPFEVSLRLGSLGEPFASTFFLDRAAWLTLQPNVRYVELLSNGSLLSRRLPALESKANLGKLSLWLTWHEGQMSLDRFLAAASFAQEEYGCFVVVNTLLFEEHDIEVARKIKAAAEDAGLRFNIDLGYDPSVPSVEFDQEGGAAAAVPVTRIMDAVDAVQACGQDSALTEAAIVGLTSPRGRPCRSGHDYIFIDIHGEVYRCSRYAVLGRQSLGNILRPDFELSLRRECWSACEASGGCCNKEDFLNLKIAQSLRSRDVPSLGWIDA